MEKKLDPAEKRAANNGGTATATASNPSGGGKKSGSKKSGVKAGERDEGTAVAGDASLSHATVPTNGDAAHAAVPTNGTSPPTPTGGKAEPAKTKLTTEQTLDLGLKKLATDQIRDLATLDRLDKERTQLAQVITDLGLEVPVDEDDDDDFQNVPAGKKKGAGITPSANGTGKGGDTNLWVIIRDYMVAKGAVEPKTIAASELTALAESHNYSTAANLLSQRKKQGFLVSPGRGLYSLPKNWKQQK
jgi:hypothetical protein